MKKFEFWREHALHSNLQSSRYQTSYLHIPVCASSWGKTVFSLAGFQTDYHCRIPQDYRTIVFLRDPIERWLSGLATWLTYRLPQHTSIEQVRDNQFALDVLFDSIRQDDHTERQRFFLHDLDKTNMTFWWIDAGFRQSFTRYFLQTFGTDISHCHPDHVTTLEGGKLIPRNYFKTVMENNTIYLNRVKEYFYEDYQLIKTTPFSNANRPLMSYYDKEYSI